ncbi:YadA-like family protein [Paraburkholderia domus]|uniref:YadA-like family protein n=1 Tax=Paraburkholderia domus TaxID=2793075 RepID=UPI0038B3C199
MECKGVFAGASGGSGSGTGTGTGGNTGGGISLEDAYQYVYQKNDLKYFHVSSTKPDSVASGADAMGIGPHAVASGTDNIAIGDEALASGGNYAIAIGGGAQAAANGAVAVGQTAQATNSSALALGNQASALATNAVALGAGSVAVRANTVSVGRPGGERQIVNVAPGTAGTDAVNLDQLRAAVSGGTPTPTPTPTPVDLKYFHANSTLADSVAGGAESVAIGGNATANANNSVALGANSLANRANVVSVGSSGAERQITNLAAGTSDTDAVNVKQLNTSIASAVTGGTLPDLVKYDDSTHATLTLGGADSTTPVALLNVKAGAVNGKSTDAVNGAQLYNLQESATSSFQTLTNLIIDTDNRTYGLAQSVAAAMGGGSKANQLDNTISAPAYAVDGTTYNNVGDAIGALASASTGTDAVKYDTSSHDKVTLRGSGSTTPVALTNVAAGQITSSSSDAVNGSQLYGTANSVAAALGGNSSVGADGKVSKPAYTLDGSTYNDVGAALNAVNAKASSGSTDGVVYDTSAHNKVTFGGTTAGHPAVTLTNVAAGQITSSSNDAVNGSQLYGAMASTAAALGGNSAVQPDGTVSKPAYTVAGTTYNDVGSAIDAVGTAVGDINNNVASTTKYIKVVSTASGATANGAESVAIGGNAFASATKSLAIGSGARAQFDNSVALGANSVVTDPNTVSIGRSGSERRIMNVAAGTNDTDAATVGQLNALQKQVVQQSSGVRSMLLGATPVTSYIAVSSNITPGMDPTSVDNTKLNAMAIGPGAESNGANSLAVGAKSLASLDGTTAVGSGAAAMALNATVIGNGATTSGDANNGVAIGYNASAEGVNAMGIGYNAHGQGDDSLAIGTNASTAFGVAKTMALGSGATASAVGAVALGAGSVGDRANAVSVGSSTAQRQIINMAAGTANTDAVNVSQLKGVTDAIGGGAGVNGDGSIKKPSYVIGGKTYTDVGTALAAAGTGTGGDSVVYDTSAHSKVTFGGTGAMTPVTLSNVAAGTANTDAVNVKQLKDLGASFDTSGNVTGGFVAYDDSSKGSITLKGAGGTTITGLKAGVLSATSTDAVNGSQLYQTNANVANVAGNVTNLTNVVNNITSGTGAGIKYFHVNSTLADSSATGTDAVAIGGKASATASGSVALGANSVANRANSVSVGAAGSERQIINVAAGTTNTDAVNLKQLKDLGASFDTSGNVTGGFVAYDSSAKSKVTFGGTGATAPVTLSNVAAGTANTDAVNLKQLKDLGASFDTSGNVSGAFVAYDDSSKGSITLKGAGGTTITGLKAGVLSATSTDAVNGSQLYQTNANVTNLTNVVNNITSGTGAGIKYFHVNSTLADSSATGTDAVAIGGNASATTSGSVALGANSVANRANSVSVGAAGSERQIINVAAGTTNTDAVNLKQLKDLGASFDTSGNVTGGFVAYDSSAKSKVTFGGTGATTPVTLSNVAAGTANTDAVNLKQLKDLGASFDTSGNVSGAFVAYDDSSKGSITLKGASGTTITGLKAGVLSATSTDAVNGSQLFQTNANVANVAGNVTNLTNVVNNITSGTGAGIKYFHVNSTLADSSATGTDAVAIGPKALATAKNSVALGANATTTANLGAVAYQAASGTLSGLTPVGEVSVGSVNNERRVTNVAAGAAATDAVNVSQLQAAVVSGTGAATADAVKYDSSSHDKITLGGSSVAMPVALTNLAAGSVTTNSRDAVNGSQLFGVSQSVADALGGGSSVSPSGTVTKPGYAVDGQTYTDVGSALDAVSATVGSINNTISNTTKYIKVVSTASAATANGGEAVAIGGNSFASANKAIAIGSGARAQFDNSVALGANAVVSAENTVSIGRSGSEKRIMNVADGLTDTDAATVGQLHALQTQFAQQSSGVRSMLLGATPVTSYIAVSSNVTAGGEGTTVDNTKLNAMAIGPSAVSNGENALAVGAQALASVDGTTAVGSGAAALANNATVIGKGASTSDEAVNGVAIGYNAQAEGANSLAFGSKAQSLGGDSIAMGSQAVTSAAATKSMALGTGATVTAAGAVALGSGAIGDRANAVSVGSSTAQRQIINVADGTQNNDAVNLGQMSRAIAAVSGGGSADAVVYDTSVHDKLTLGGATSTTPVALTNVAAGQVTSSSKDAVNGAQLYNTASSVATALGGGATVGTDGKVSKPAYTLNGNTYTDVAAALSAVNDKAGSGSTDGVVYDTPAHDKVSLGGVGAKTPVTVSNVADGVANNDAVNVKQLKALGAGFDSSGNVTSAFVAYDDANKAQVTFGGAGSTTPVVLANVAAGQVSSASRQAVNGSQLYGAMSSTAAALGGGSTVGSDGKVSTPSYKVSGNTYTGVGAALAALDAKATTGSPDGVVYDTSTHDRLTLGNTGTPVTVANVADAKSDDEAVNLKQLKEAGLTVDTSGNVTNSFIAYDNATKGTVTFNAGGAPTQLKNVAAGTDATDAVNFGQMQTYVAQNAGSGGTANGVAYDDASKSKVTLGGAGSTTPVTLTNVAAGTSATDAVNYSQFSSLQSVVNNLSNGGAGNTTYVNIDNSSTGGTAAVASGTDAIAIGNGASATGTEAIAIGKGTTTAGDNSVALGGGSSAPNANAVALGANSTTDRDNSVSVGSAGNERQITNVAAGTQATDAVNLGQLNNAMGGMQQSINNVDRSAAKGIASASALNIVTPYLPGRTTLNAGVANYRGYQAVGLGVSRWNEKGTINYNLGVSSSGGNSTIVRAGIGIVLGN